MWQPSWNTANFIYELSNILLLVGIFTTGIAAAGIWWVAPIREAHLKMEATLLASQTLQPEEAVRGSQFDVGKEKLARVLAETRPRPKQLTDEQTTRLSTVLGDSIRQILIIRAADGEAAIFARQLATAFERAKISSRVGVVERETAPPGLFLYDPDETRGAALVASFDQAHIDIAWEKRLHPRFPGQPILLVGRSSAIEERNLPVGGQQP